MKKMFGMVSLLTAGLTLSACSSTAPAPATGSPAQEPAAAPARTPATEAECAAFDRSPSGEVFARVDYTDIEDAFKVAISFEPWEFNREQKFLTLAVTQEQFEQLRASGEQLGFRVSIDEQLTEQQSALARGEGLGAQAISGQYPCFRTVQETYAAAQSIVQRYPNLATWRSFGQTANGNPIYELVLTNKSVGGTKPKVMFNSALHAREYATAELNLRFAERLVAGYGVDPDITWMLDSQEFHLILMTNPDGRAKAEQGQLWRKNVNTRFCPTSKPGVDLNRNFAVRWNTGGSSADPCNETFRGPSAGSEAETQALQNLMKANFPDRRSDSLDAAAPLDTAGIYIDIHSYSRLNLWPWGSVQQSPANGAALENLGRKFSYYNGHDPMQAIGLYPTSGSTDEYLYGTLGVAAFTFELGDAFFENCSRFTSDILPRNLNALMYAAKVARAPYQLAGGPDTVNVALSGTTLSATVTDTQAVGASAQGIRSAEYFIDTPPWAGGTAIPMTAADGSFGSTSEAVRASVNTAGLSQGRHLIYMRGTDSGGNTGPVSAVFLDVGGTSPAPTPPAGNTYTGTVSSGTSSYQPGTGGFSSTGGTLRGQLSGPSGTDFDLYLQKLSGGSWTTVARSELETSSESITYAAASGTYRWQVYAYSGSGSYTLTEQR
ncbi:Carboxypeptidase A., Aqualysin 1 [Deinococcus proteolyticus MRP]|uniref:carboxypeptidase T n=1 Tax=Deinococcus proteolyticus (strain ATCC 35074 / DSM 20540 / JCM 6276 / NBRC 101906 / NCIMB 13154 / VKM Ac-1939 / CCM 2703 / MRP) TaxID=693977 RepID=F0RK12_DEIPM|nr:M14 family zinc carboxypeptidase [Deinococcus proteolyticus]ADY26658.1 Carboxypeptidase A., Aqualysin 1 [Deinococcus proteolyticus MRP]